MHRARGRSPRHFPRPGGDRSAFRIRPKHLARNQRRRHGLARARVHARNFSVERDGLRHRARSVLVVAQVALSMVLLIGCGLLIRSFIRLRSVSPGFNPNNVLTMQISLRKYARSSEGIAFYKNVIDRVAALPGVEAVAISTALPPTATHQTPVLFEGQPAVALGKRPIVNLQQISPEYANALGIPLLGGRMFTDHDDAQS